MANLIRKIIGLNNSRKSENNNETDPVDAERDLLELTKGLLSNARMDISDKKTISMPIAQLSTLGAGVSSLIPSLRTVVQTSTIQTSGLFQLANAGVGDTLKIAKNGNFWGAFKTAEGTSKFAQLKNAEPLSLTQKITMKFNPATMMMAVALFSIEKELGKIAEMGQQILSFLEIEKESEIEADIEMLMEIISNYKFNWDNERYLASHHQVICDIQRTARKNMNSYQKNVAEIIEAKHLIVVQAKIESALNDLRKKFKYYRLSLYAFAMASFLEIMLSGNFREEYVNEKKSEIETMSNAYRDIFSQCSVYLEKLGKSSIETNVLKGIGAASKAVGNFIGNIPVIKEGRVDEFLQDGGTHMKGTALDMETSAVESFAEISNPGTQIFSTKMEDMIQIYNHTTQICFDRQNIYLVIE